MATTVFGGQSVKSPEIKNKNTAKGLREWRFCCSGGRSDFGLIRWHFRLLILGWIYVGRGVIIQNVFHLVQILRTWIF